MVICTHGIVEIQTEHMQQCICFKNSILHLPDILKWRLMENKDAFLRGAGCNCDSRGQQKRRHAEHFRLRSKIERFQVYCEDRRALCA